MKTYKIYFSHKTHVTKKYKTFFLRLFLKKKQKFQF